MSPDYLVGLVQGIMIGFPAALLTLILGPDLRSEVRAWRRGRR